jgi:hypothetical protein
MSNATAPVTNLNEREAALAASGAGIIGAIVGTGQHAIGLRHPVSRAKVRATLAKWGIDIPAERAPQDTLAWSAWDLGKAYRGYSVEVSKLEHASDTTASYGVFLAGADGEKRRRDLPGARVRVDTLAGVAIAVGPEVGAADERCLRHAEKCAHYANFVKDHVVLRDLPEIGETLRDRFKAVGVYGKRSGVYWVPAPFIADVTAFAADLASIGYSLAVNPQHAAINAAAATVAAAGATQTFGERIEELRAVVGETLTKGKRADALVNCAEAAQALRSQIALYREVAGFQAAEYDKLAAELSAFFTEAGARKARGDKSTVGMPTVGSLPDPFAIEGAEEEEAAPVAPADPFAVVAVVAAPVADPFAIE